MQMKFYSPLTADFFPNEPDYEDEFYDEYEGCPLDGHDLLQYADAVDEAVKKDIADFNGDCAVCGNLRQQTVRVSDRGAERNSAR